MKYRSNSRPAKGLRAAALSLALAGALFATAAQAQRGPAGPMVRATSPLVIAGGEAEVAGMGFTAGQKVTLVAGGKSYDYVADAEGRFEGKLAIPADAALGPFNVAVNADGAAEPLPPLEVKVSKAVPLSGQDKFDVAGEKLVQGLYQSAYSAKSDALFVTSAVGRPPVKVSELVKVDPKTLKIVARVAPQPAPAPAPQPGQPPREGGLYAVYGVAVDDANGNVWVTNTRQNTVAVYRQSDLGLVKQFPVDAVPHSRDVVVDAADGRAYASPVGEPFLSVFDTKTLAQLPNIEIASTVAGEKFIPTSLDLDAKTGKVYTVSLGTPEAAVIDGRSGKVEKVFALEGVKSAIGVAYDGDAGHLLVVSQGSDNLLILDANSGKVLHDVYVGAGALNVAYEPVSKLAFVSSRAAGTVTVVDAGGRIVGNLDGGSNPNHVQEDGKGNVFAVNKSRGEDDPKGDRVTRITPKAK